MASLIRLAIAPVFLVLLAGPAGADDPPIVPGVALQPLASAVERVAGALDAIGRPLSADERAALKRAAEDPDEAAGSAAIQKVLDPHCLAVVNINPESRVKAARGPAAAELVQGGWRVFLVKVHNEAGVTAPLRCNSPDAGPIYTRSTNRPDPDRSVSDADVRRRWLDLATYDDRPLNKGLSGLAVEYRIVQLYARDAGRREATLSFDVGQGTQDLGFRAELAVLFDCEPSIPVTLEVLDHDGKPTMASFLVRDTRGRVYPHPGRRLAPDFFFHPQVYRRNGESISLPAGEYTVEFTRGPEYRVGKRSLTVPEGVKEHRESFRLERWAHLADRGWYSGDHHVHAAGCAHYESPTEGVTPADMMRHILGEDLNVGCVLSWGPCWYAQKEFFDGEVHPLSTPENLMRYDVEVSGFPSSHTGHLCLLRLKEDDYPGTTRIEEWPSWDLPVLKWGKEQGGVVGFSHSGWGLKMDDYALPSYQVPPYDGIGANEYIVDVVHDAVDFISTVDTPAPWELTIWYHTLNCGFRTRISGETDFPCIYGQRVGLGRVYVKPESGPLDFDRWVAGLKAGRSYVTDGRSHLLDFRVDDREAGVGDSELKLEAPTDVTVRATVSALLPEEVTAEARAIRDRPLDQQPYWELERSRLGDSRRVPVEVVVNGQAVARQEIVADGTFRDLEFRVPIARSSWVALRIYPSSHTNPVFVTVAGRPVRASRRSADWCLSGVDRCWDQKSPLIRPAEQAAARAAFDAARAAYRAIREESEVD